MYEPETGHGTDTWHQTLDDAFDQAQWEFGIAREEWMKTDRPFLITSEYAVISPTRENTSQSGGIYQ